MRRLPALEGISAGNPLGDEALAALVALPPAAGAPPLPTGGMKMLELLCLSDTQVTDVGCATLVAAINSGKLPEFHACGLTMASHRAVARAAVMAAIHGNDPKNR